MAVSKLPLDDIIKAVLNQARKAMGKPYYIQFRDEVTGKVAKDIGKAKVTYGPPKSVKKGGEADYLSPMSKRKFDKVYGKGSAKQVAEQTKRNAKKK
jgi:hypothetical protein